jgi:hypothetical protein
MSFVFADANHTVIKNVESGETFEFPRHTHAGAGFGNGAGQGQPAFRNASAAAP